MMTDYEIERNALIPAAEAFADKKCGAKCKGKTEKERVFWAAKWNRSFHDRMNQLWGERNENQRN